MMTSGNCHQPDPTFSLIATDGWSTNSVNAVIFRKSPLWTFADTQYAAYYDQSKRFILACRTLPNGPWKTQATPFHGNVSDAHNSISIAVDGSGMLHAAWDHHNTSLKYATAEPSNRLALGPLQTMLGEREERVCYPEFYPFSNGDLLFAYRDGMSGNGNLVLNTFNHRTRTWSRIHSNLIDGGNRCNPYWQIHVDPADNIHISWCWRDTPDLSSNHDLCYAVSFDRGHSWQRSDGSPYALPITVSNAELVWPIPVGSLLLNQTSMTADKDGHPIIASFWREAGDIYPQYHVVYCEKGVWRRSVVTKRSSLHEVGGAGSRQVPVSRPLVLADPVSKRIYLIYRDCMERGGRVTVAVRSGFDDKNGCWEERDVTPDDQGYWEPSMDPAQWIMARKIHLFLQKVAQPDGIDKDMGTYAPPEDVRVLELP